MEPYRQRRVQRSTPAFYLLILLGCGIILFSLVHIACAFVVNYADDYEVSGGGGIEEAVQSGFNYSQYWAGIPFLITGILIIFAGVWQRARGLTIATVIFCFLSIAVTLCVISFESGNFSFWNLWNRQKQYNDSRDGYSCTTTNSACTCTDNNGVSEKIFSYTCETASELSALYGVIIGSAIIVALLSMFAALIIAKSLTWKRTRYVRHHHSYHPEEYNNYNYATQPYQRENPVLEVAEQVPTTKYHIRENITPGPVYKEAAYPY